MDSIKPENSRGNNELSMDLMGSHVSVASLQEYIDAASAIKSPEDHILFDYLRRHAKDKT